MVSSQEITPQGLDQAIYHAIKDTPGGAAAIAGLCGIPHQTLLNAANLNTRSRVSLNQLECLLQGVREPTPILNALAALTPNGGLFVPWVELDSRDTEGSVLSRMLELVESVGEYGKAARAALDDGKVDGKEWEQLQCAAIGVIQEAHMLLNLLGQRRG